jgi:uncharacterized protein YndB with AHSA1/START domain
MATVKLHFEIDINAPKKRVWEVMFADATYREWTSAFSPGSYFEGSWTQGARIRFLGPNPGGEPSGISSRIAEVRPYEFMGIEHLGMINAGVEDTTSDAVKRWVGAREHYSFSETNGVTMLRVEQDMATEYEAMMRDMWPKALAKLKAIVER